MTDVRMPDGVVVRFPDHFSQTQIRGLIAHKFPRQVGEATLAAGKTPDAGHPEFVPPQTVSPVEDIGRSLGTGLRDAAEGTAGMLGDIPKFAMDAHRWIAERLGASPEYLAEQARSADAINANNPFPTTGRVHEKTSEIVGPSYTPQTTAGEWARTAGQVAPIAIAPGSARQKVLSLAGAVTGKEGGERATKALGFDEAAPYVGMVASILGGGLPAIGSNHRLIADAASDLGVKARDMTRIIKRMQQDGMTPDAINAEMQRLGGQSTLMEMGPNLRQEAQRIVAKGGDGRKTIDQTLRTRDEGANARLRADVDESLGPYTRPDRVINHIETGQTNLGPAYDEALFGASPIDASALAAQLDHVADVTRGKGQTQAQAVRRMLNVTGGNELSTNPRTLLSTRQAIDGLIATETDPTALGVLQSSRRAVDEELTRAVPNIKEVDAQYEELGRQRDALGDGERALDSGRTATRPEVLEEQFAANAVPREGSQFIGPSAASLRMRHGARAEVERLLGTEANDKVALNRAVKGEGDWNRSRLSTMFGRENTDQAIAALDREKKFAETSNRTIYNSATAERMSDGTGFSASDAFKAGGPKALMWTGLSKLSDAVIDRVRGQAVAARDANVAKLLSSNDRNKIVTALMKANGGKSVGQKQIEQAVKMLLLVPGSSAQFRG